jgi:hypothetical protein
MASDATAAAVEEALNTPKQSPRQFAQPFTSKGGAHASVSVDRRSL